MLCLCVKWDHGLFVAHLPRPRVLLTRVRSRLGHGCCFHGCAGCHWLTAIHPTGLQPGPSRPHAPATSAGIPNHGGTTRCGIDCSHRAIRSRFHSTSPRSASARGRLCRAAPNAMLGTERHSPDLLSTRGKSARIRPSCLWTESRSCSRMEAPPMG